MGRLGSRLSGLTIGLQDNAVILLFIVMPALVAGIHDFRNAKRKTWIPGTSPGMTILESVPR
jgi:hypothetical protein